MAQIFGYGANVYPVGDHYRGRRMAQIVESDRRQMLFFWKILIVVVYELNKLFIDGVRMHRLAVPGSE